MKVSKKEFVKAFAEWDRRYRANPEGFMSDVEHLLENTSHSYGEACAKYFEILLKETK